MRAVYKYALKPADAGKPFTQMWLPKGAQVLDVAFQRGQAHLWALVPADVGHPTELRLFEVYPTGVPVIESDGTELQYIATFLSENTNFVFHLFERKEIKS